MNSFLEDLQYDIARKLMREYSGIPVFAYTADNLEVTLGTSFGMSLVVMPPLPKRVVPNLPGLAYEKLSIRIRVIEIPSTNSTGYRPLGFVEDMCRKLNHWTPAFEGVETPLVISEENPWKEIRDPEKMGRFILEAEFTLSAYPKTPYVRKLYNENDY